MASEYKTGGEVISARAEMAADVLSGDFSAVAFVDSAGVSYTVTDCGGLFSSLCVIGKATTQNAVVKVQVRNAEGDEWLDIAEVTLVAGVAALVYDAAIRARYFRLVAKDALIAGASVDVSYCIR